MRTLFWIFFLAALLEGGFLIYHFATYEHAAIPANIDTRSAYAESLHVYKERLQELQASADFTREKLNRVGKSAWPAVHDRLEQVDVPLQGLASFVADGDGGQRLLALEGLADPHVAGPFQGTEMRRQVTVGQLELGLDLAEFERLDPGEQDDDRQPRSLVDRLVDQVVQNGFGVSHRSAATRRARKRGGTRRT